MLLQYLRDSTHALNVSFHIMRPVLFRHLIEVNFRLYMDLDRISEVRNVLIYLAVIGKNIIRTIRQALMKFSKPGTHGEQSTLWIIIRKVWYRIYESRILW